jgi:pyruvate/2-oxoacid:ferredoxin oxidoreductase alpha subunit
MKKLLEGNLAVSYGVMLSRAQVIPVYPITPQTHISEALAEMVADGRLTARYIKVESEHSAMAACIGAATAGARTFTATSAQGLALMHELLHWASGARLPIVMADVNRTLAAPWNIWNDQSDSMSERDTGWLQFYCEDNQECLDSIIMAYRVSERLLIPSMVVLDAFILSHTQEIVDIPDASAVDKFLPPLSNPFALDINRPRAYSPVAGPDHFTELKYKQWRAAEDARNVIAEVNEEFSRTFNRSYPHVAPYRTEDAQVAIMACGAVCGTIRAAVDELRAAGVRAGMVKVRTFRPFPEHALRELLAPIGPTGRIGVLDKSAFAGAASPLFTETRAALYGLEKPPMLTGLVGGLGGRDITVQVVADAFRTLISEKPDGGPIFLGLKPDGENATDGNRT